MTIIKVLIHKLIIFFITKRNYFKLFDKIVLDCFNLDLKKTDLEYIIKTHLGISLYF